MSGAANGSPRDVTFADITSEQAESLKAAYTKSAAVDGVNVSFNEQPQIGGLITLEVRFSALAGAVPPAPAATGTVMAGPAIQIAWGRAVGPDFKKSVLDICSGLRMDPNFLMACIAFETGQSFRPDKINSLSGATGLIQFMPNTAISLGTTTAALSKMTAVEQLNFVEKYFSPHSGKLHSLSDVYMAILWPRGIGQPESFVLFSAPSVTYAENKGLDSNNDGQVTKAEAAARVHQMLINGLAKANLG